jgi:uncharacterized protein YndB with AHSA1/START domain
MGEIRIEHVFDVPREAVFAAWTDPAEIAAWFGPDGFTAPAERMEIDLRVGGRYAITMVRPDGGELPSTVYEILELVEPELLVLRCEPMPEYGFPDPVMTRVEFHDDDGRTRMVLTDGPYPDAAPAETGWTQSFEKLARYLVARMTSRT